MLSSAPRRRHGAACARPQQVVYELKYVQACPNLFNRLYGRVRDGVAAERARPAHGIDHDRPTDPGPALTVNIIGRYRTFYGSHVQLQVSGNWSKRFTSRGYTFKGRPGRAGEMFTTARDARDVRETRRFRRSARTTDPVHRSGSARSGPGTPAWTPVPPPRRTRVRGSVQARGCRVRRSAPAPCPAARGPRGRRDEPPRCPARPHYPVF